MNYKVSVLIPVYNRSAVVINAIESVLSQSYGDIEIIIGDNCSTDGTWDVINNYARKFNNIKIFKNDKNIGPVKNWAECLKRATGKFCVFLWSDDILYPNFIEKCITNFSEEISFVFSGIEFKDNDGKTLKKVYHINNGLVESKKYLKGILLLNKENYPFSPACAMFRTKDLKNNLLIEIDNSLDLKFSVYGAGNDLLIFLLTAVKYKYIYILDYIGCSFTVHNESLSIKNDLRIYYYYAKYYFIINLYQSVASQFVSLLVVKGFKHRKYLQIVKLFPKRYCFNFFYVLVVVMNKLSLIKNREN